MHRWLTAEYRGHPRWMLGVDADASRSWWWFAAVICPIAAWTAALILVPYGESIDQMRPVGSGVSLAAAPLFTWLRARRCDERFALTRATILALGLIAWTLVGLTVIAFCAFVVYVALAWPSG